MDYRIENCANSAESAQFAQQGGAYRVELCAGMPEGGTTPSYGTILAARRALAIRLNVIIRPRGGDFLYSPLEQEIMCSDIAQARALGADGVVLGCLTPDGDVDKPLMSRFLAAADGMEVTFHRAFDLCRDPHAALEDLISLGCTRLLTSGCAPTALAGAATIKSLVEQSRGRIIVMPGCGITPANIAEIAQRTGASEFHLSGRHAVPSAMRFRHPGVSMGGTVKIEEYSTEVTDPQTIKSTLDALHALH
jgi:copper homeostasis protein